MNRTTVLEQSLKILVQVENLEPSRSYFLFENWGIHAV